MATSGTYDWTSSRDFIITEAFKKIGRLGDFETIDANRLNNGIAAINPMIKAFHSLGMPVWAITEQYIPLSNWASTNYVTIGPGGAINQPIKPLKILQANRRDNSTVAFPNDVGLQQFSYEDFQSLAQKQYQGTPTTIWYQPQGYVGQIALWPRADTYWQTNGQLYIRYQRPFQDFDTSTDEPDFPVEWHEALIYNLAARLASQYGVPSNDRAMLKQEAKEALEMAKGFDMEEASIFLQPTQDWR